MIPLSFHVLRRPVETYIIQVLYHSPCTIIRQLVHNHASDRKTATLTGDPSEVQHLIMGTRTVTSRYLIPAYQGSFPTYHDNP
jgi:hypothetical protein